MFRSTTCTNTDTSTTHHAVRACLRGRHGARGHTKSDRALEGARWIRRAHPSHRVAYGAGLQRQRQLIAHQRVVGRVQQASCAGPSGTKVSLDEVCGEVQNAPDRGWRRRDAPWTPYQLRVPRFPSVLLPLNHWRLEKRQFAAPALDTSFVEMRSFAPISSAGVS